MDENEKKKRIYTGAEIIAMTAAGEWPPPPDPSVVPAVSEVPRYTELTRYTKQSWGNQFEEALGTPQTRESTEASREYLNAARKGFHPQSLLTLSYHVQNCVMVGWEYIAAAESSDPVAAESFRLKARCVGPLLSGSWGEICWDRDPSRRESRRNAIVVCEEYRKRLQEVAYDPHGINWKRYMLMTGVLFLGMGLDELRTWKWGDMNVVPGRLNSEVLDYAPAGLALSLETDENQGPNKRYERFMSVPKWVVQGWVLAARDAKSRGLDLSPDRHVMTRWNGSGVMTESGVAKTWNDAVSLVVGRRINMRTAASMGRNFVSRLEDRSYHYQVRESMTEECTAAHGLTRVPLVEFIREEVITLASADAEVISLQDAAANLQGGSKDGTLGSAESNPEVSMAESPEGTGGSLGVSGGSSDVSGVSGTDGVVEAGDLGPTGGQDSTGI